MNSKQRGQVRRRLAPILRAVEGGYYDDVLGPPSGFTDRSAFAERTRALLDQPWTFPRGAEDRRVLAVAMGARKAARR